MCHEGRHHQKCPCLNSGHLELPAFGGLYIIPGIQLKRRFGAEHCEESSVCQLFSANQFLDIINTAGWLIHSAPPKCPFQLDPRLQISGLQIYQYGIKKSDIDRIF